MADTGTKRAETQPNGFGTTYQFHQVFEEEIEVIARRRAQLERKCGRGSIEHAAGARLKELKLPKDDAGQPIPTPPETANLVGLSLSGGGIRSAAFCLGTLQALDAVKVLERVDYLSTVSGGGYIGCSLTATLESSGQQGGPEFPFPSWLKEDEPVALQHIRDYSNYLFPRGFTDLLHNAAIYARGLVVNALLLAPFLLVGAALTLFAYLLRLDPAWLPSPLGWLLNPLHLSHFSVTVNLGIALIVTGVLWGIIQSTGWRRTRFEIPGIWTSLVGFLVIVFFIALFCEAQPLVLDAMVGNLKTKVIATAEVGATASVGAGASANTSARLLSVFSSWANSIAAVLVPIAAAFAFLANKVGEYVKSSLESPKLSAQIKGYAMKAGIVLAGLVLPFLLWVAYLNFTYWGLCIDAQGVACSPSWLKNIVEWMSPWLQRSVDHGNFSHAHMLAVMIAYIAAAVILFLLTLLLQPNANSLHPLYRDRLGKAFLFRKWLTRSSQRQDADLVEEWLPPLSQISGLYGPYHLINTALNVEASKTVNRRGRNADFFMFSPRFVGSKSTGYVKTADMENIALGLNLATAMAASGAAVSSNMGARSIKPLTATLALLNIRLGFWLRNPNKLRNVRQQTGKEASSSWRSKAVQPIKQILRTRNLFANYYFLLEMFGFLSERRKSVYLTDGGHIENLGIYELLRRGCRIIIAVDAEADSQMAFGSFNMLERYALIDMGVRIDLPWQKIADESLATGKAIDDKGDAPKHKGPHCAIGEISYPNNRKGILVYIKASLTGDENDYIFDYKKRCDDFPHETTLDQWFTEEQFEAYRALGFHAAYGLFSGSDDFARLDADDGVTARSQVATLNDLLFHKAGAGCAAAMARTAGVDR